MLTVMYKSMNTENNISINQHDNYFCMFNICSSRIISVLHEIFRNTTGGAYFLSPDTHEALVEYYPLLEILYFLLLKFDTACVFLATCWDNMLGPS